MHTDQTGLRFAAFLPYVSSRVSELQIRGGIKDNSKIIFLISACKHML